jgi:hypothetical protein
MVIRAPLAQNLNPWDGPLFGRQKFPRRWGLFFGGWPNTLCRQPIFWSIAICLQLLPAHFAVCLTLGDILSSNAIWRLAFGSFLDDLMVEHIYSVTEPNAKSWFFLTWWRLYPIFSLHELQSLYGQFGPRDRRLYMKISFKVHYQPILLLTRIWLNFRP